MMGFLTAGLLVIMKEFMNWCRAILSYVVYFATSPSCQ
jgi:hypothetical protein